MIPIRLQIAGFLSYQDLVELDFTSFDLACISGANGAGKSSILDSMTWVLFGQARRRDDSVINSHANTAEVIFDFEYEGNVYRVQRAKTRNKPMLVELFIYDNTRGWRPLSERAVRSTDERIQSTLRLDYETFTNASFFLQGKADQFAQQRPGDRKRILSNILGLDIWETYRERAAARRKTQEAELYILSSNIQEINSELAEESQRRERLAVLEKELEQITALREEKEKSFQAQRALAAALAEKRRLVDMLAAQLETMRQRQQQRQEDLQNRMSEHQTFQQRIEAANEIEAAYQRWQQLREELQHWQALAADFHQFEMQRSAVVLKIETERTRLEQEQRFLQEEQAAIEQNSLLLSQLNQNLQQTQTEIAQLQTQVEKKNELENQLRQAQETQSNCQAENKRLKDLMNELKERIERLNVTSGAQCPLCGQPLTPEDRQKLIDDLTAQGKAQGDAYRTNIEAIQQASAQCKEIEAALQQISTLEEKLRQQQRLLDQLTDRKMQIETLIAKWQTENQPKLIEINRVLEEGDYAHKARTELAQIDASMKEMGYDPAAHEAVRIAEQEHRSSEEQYRLLENARSALAPLEREIAALQQQIRSGDEEILAQQRAYEEAEAGYACEAASLPDLNQAEAELLAVKERENHLHLEVGAARQSVEVLKNLHKRLKTLTAQKEEKNRLIGQLKSLERAFSKDGIPALLIEQALPEIEAHANAILDRLSPQGMSVSFSTQREFKDKNRDDKKETLDIIIHDPAGAREYEMYSGGEAFRINFAIRLALSRVLAQRAGARLQTLVIDEGFGSQDAEGRQRLVEAINLVQQDFAKILVITHLEELKDHFPARIEVEKGIRGSTARLVL
ncbi:MAG: SMC family ATPase [Anaerolineae bacterium]|nr:SMC family ATPase [Anaerolineae bacterium]